MKRLFLRVLAGALCFALIGCTEETPTDQPTTSQPTPVVTATADATSQSSEDPTANGVAGNNGTTSSAEDSDSANDSIATRMEPVEKTDLKLMKIDSGKDRVFQNGLNEAELAYTRARNEKKRKARIEAAESRKNGSNSGNDAPVHDMGGDGLITVRP